MTDERGETGLVQLGIDTGDAPPKKQAPPYVKR